MTVVRISHFLIASLMIVTFARAGDPPTSQESIPAAKQSTDRPMAPRLVADLAGRVEDRKPLPEGNPTDPPEEYKAYCLALLTAKATSDEAFANSALRDVPYVDLFEDPERYRGEVIRLQGRLKRISKRTAPKFVRDDIPAIYECATFDLTRYGANPFIVVVTELPRGLREGDQADVPVTMDAYFFKRYRYRAGDGMRDAPLLIGRTLVIDASALTDRHDNHMYTKEFVIVCLLLIGTTLAILIGLTWWYRHGDRRVQAVLAAKRPLPSFEHEAIATDGPNGAPALVQKEAGNHE